MTALTLAVPVYQMETWLERFVASALRQTATDFELLLVDDGSTDRSAALCDAYAARYPTRVRVLHKPNGGLASARNAGIEAAAGRYICFPDPDDWLEPDYVERFLSLQTQHRPDLLCLGYTVDTEDNCVPAAPGQSARRLRADEAQEELLRPGGLGGFAWNKLYSLRRIREAGLRFSSDCGTAEDLDFAFRYLSHCQSVFYAPEARLYHYCQRPGGATRSGFDRAKLATLRCYEGLLEQSAGRARLQQLCGAALGNEALNLLYLCQRDTPDDHESLARLRGCLKRQLGAFLACDCYGLGRKLQALTALLSARLYCLLKTRLTKG